MTPQKHIHGITTWEYPEDPILEASGTGRLTIAVNYGKQQFQVVLCLLHQVPTLLKNNKRGLGINM